jgi:hypothetical protein
MAMILENEKISRSLGGNGGRPYYRALFSGLCGRRAGHKNPRINPYSPGHGQGRIRGRTFSRENDKKTPDAKALVIPPLKKTDRRYPSPFKSLFKIFMILHRYQNLGAFLAQSAKNRAFRDSAIATAPALRAVAAAHPSNPFARAEALPVIEQTLRQ